MLAFVAIDYVTGFVAAGMEGKLSSEVGIKGIAKRVFIFVMVAVAHLADQPIGNEVIRCSDILLPGILLSIAENSGRIGLPVPPIITRAVELLSDKSKTHEVSKE